VNNNSGLLERVLRQLHENGILSDLILLGSWYLAVYRENFQQSPEIPLLRTLDVDFLIPNPSIINKPADVPDLLQHLGFDVIYSVLGGFSKFMHPELEIEFLTPELGKGRSTPYKVTALKIVAQRLRYVSLAEQYAVGMTYNGLPVRVPEPAAFVLLKFLTSEKRKNLSKGKRDISTASQLAEFLLGKPAQGQLVLSLPTGDNSNFGFNAQMLPYISLPIEWALAR
jgi:hypothetical protein